MKKLTTLLLTSSLLLSAGCAQSPAAKSTMTSLQIQAIQAQTFNVDKTTAFNAVMMVFQDKGYIVKSASLDTGFITAQSPTSDSNANETPAEKVSLGLLNLMAIGLAAKNGSVATPIAPQHTMVSTTATAFISSVTTTSTRVRLNFVSNTMTSVTGGQNKIDDKPVLDANLYQSAFASIQQQLFTGSAEH